MSTQIIHKKQDLTYLTWSLIRSSSGTAGSFLKATDDLQKPKIYYKLSNYDIINGVVGHECVNELIVDRLLNILGVEHLHYDLLHADIIVNGKAVDTYLCASEDFKQSGENKMALDAFYQAESLENETPKQNLSLIPKDQMPVFNTLKKEHKSMLLDGLNGIISTCLQEKIWNMIWQRWQYYEALCNQR